MTRRRYTREDRGSRSKFESSLLSGLLNWKATNTTKNSCVPPSETKPAAKDSGSIAGGSPASRYIDSKGAAAYLGVSKAKFFRLRSKGHFRPSPVTGLYHLDDLDREARAVQPPSPDDNSDEEATQKIFGKSESKPPLAHGGSSAKPVSQE